MTKLFDTRARFAAQEAASLADMQINASADSDMSAAEARLVRDLNTLKSSAAVVCSVLLKHLQESELTINFEAFKFFNKKPENEKYVSQFEGGNTWGDPTYMQMRDEAEEAMFDYSGTVQATSPEAAAAKTRVKKLGERNRLEFEGAVRPKYAALNYARLKYGSAAQWGKSYMVLKPYVQHNATYVHTDSFDISGSTRQRAMLAGQLANFHQMQRLLVNMALSMLKALESASRGVRFGEATQPPDVGDTAYIEAHVHSEIRFDRDIQKLVINQDEVNKCLAATTKLNTEDKKRWKVISSKKLKERFEKFANTYGIELAYS
jgi:hypothetical protein